MNKAIKIALIVGGSILLFVGLSAAVICSIAVSSPEYEMAHEFVQTDSQVIAGIGSVEHMIMLGAHSETSTSNGQKTGVATFRFRVNRKQVVQVHLECCDGVWQVESWKIE